MKFTKRQPAPRGKVETRAYERLRTLSEFEVLNWTEQAVNGLHMTLDVLRRPERVVDAPAAVAEARKAVDMLAGAVAVLEERHLSR